MLPRSHPSNDRSLAATNRRMIGDNMVRYPSRVTFRWPCKKGELHPLASISGANDLSAFPTLRRTGQRCAACAKLSNVYIVATAPGLVPFS